VIEGELNASGKRFGIVVSRFNSFITDRLLGGALDAIARTGGDVGTVDVAKVPGSIEIATAAKAMAESGNYDAVICLGAVIRGETDHYAHVAGETSRNVAALGVTTGVPVIFGVLTTETLEQANDRAGGRHGNKGWEAAQAAIETASLLDRLPKQEG
jgi:6,7-dimethyl-8-ribityllumazine synthase